MRAECLVLPALLVAIMPGSAHAVAARTPIPAFARLYRTTCSTCHTAAPKLNALGEAFRLNGYELPDEPRLLRREEPLALGEEPWKELWPRSIWPGEIPRTPPVSLRVQSDVQATRDEAAGYGWTYRFPHEVYLLAGTSFGSGISGFLEVEWEREGEMSIAQAKFAFRNVLPFLPEGALGVTLGQQSLFLFGLAERQTDRAARQRFLWQSSTPADLELARAGSTFRSVNEFSLAAPQPALEMNGMIGSRLLWGAGLAQGTSSGATDRNNHKDAYYRVRYKIGGLGLDGRYPGDEARAPGWFGQLLDRSLTLEHFGYFGAESGVAGSRDTHRSWGLAARLLWDRLDLGAGWVRMANDGPWGLAQPGGLDRRSVFGKAEVLVYPWLIGSLKAEDFRWTLPEGASLTDGEGGHRVETRWMPGMIGLVRQNIRLVAEAELFGAAPPGSGADSRRPHNLWLRLDIAF